MKISIIGSGAMGSLYGGKLSIAGNDVILYDINKEHVNAVNKKGLIIEELSSGDKITANPFATLNPEAVKDSDILIIFVKSTVTNIVAEQFKIHTKPDTLVITMQNGLGNEEIIRNAFGRKRTAAGVTSHGATFSGPGIIKHAGEGPTYLCMSDKNNEKLIPFVETLNKAGFETHLEENIDNLIWSKLILNVGINALTAITRIQNGRLLDYPELKDIIRDLVTEAVTVAESIGIKLTFENPVEAVYKVCEKTALNRSSMLQDFDRGSTSEIDFINNAIVKEAANSNIDVPVNKTIGKIIKALDTIHLEERQGK